MFLVHENKNRPGKWEVAWMWLPHFLAADVELHKLVDKTMTERFRGKEVDGELVGQMHSLVVDLILDRYSIAGLRQFLKGYASFTDGAEITKKESLNAGG